MNRPDLSGVLPAARRAVSKLGFLTLVAYVLLGLGLLAMIFH